MNSVGGAQREGWNRGREGGLESNKNWSDVAERREKSKLKVEL